MISKDQLIRLLPNALKETNLPLPNKTSGKVRDWYDLPNGKRLIVTTDRLSAFDILLASVPYKGQVLNQLSACWFDQTKDIIPNHMASLPDSNAVVVNVAEPFLVEVIVRGYITGVTSTALWYRYSLGERNIYGYDFPEGLQKNAALPEPIITPTTKGGATGHDERLTCEEVVEKGWLDKKTWDQVQTAALAIFKRGQEVARRTGIILVDTKYEFGRTADGRVVLIDEIHTPELLPLLESGYLRRTLCRRSRPGKLRQGIYPDCICGKGLSRRWKYPIHACRVVDVCQRAIHCHL